ncbi:DUF6167 family protein [Nocardioides sp.]|uniref:DUF6167 family protein n=1 Tax=Nocardioides sp. TaxID=35761 RepID=UPI003517643B
MKAGVWFAAGAAAGVYGVVRVRRLAEAFTPDGMRDRLGAVVLGARLLAEEVAQGQAEAEVRLREQYRSMQDAARGDIGPAALEGRTTTAGRPAPTSHQEGH